MRAWQLIVDVVVVAGARQLRVQVPCHLAVQQEHAASLLRVARRPLVLVVQHPRGVAWAIGALLPADALDDRAAERVDHDALAPRHSRRPLMDVVVDDVDHVGAHLIRVAHVAPRPVCLRV